MLDSFFLDRKIFNSKISPVINNFFLTTMIKQFIPLCSTYSDRGGESRVSDYRSNPFVRAYLFSFVVLVLDLSHEIHTGPYFTNGQDPTGLLGNDSSYLNSTVVLPFLFLPYSTVISKTKTNM